MDGIWSDRPSLTCTSCGVRIGVYERCWVREPEGTLTEAGHARARERHLEGAELFHLGCLAPDRLGGAVAAAACGRCGRQDFVSDRLPDGSWVCWDCMTVEERARMDG